MQHEGKGVPEASLPFDRALPSLTHMALVELEKTGILKFVISQVSFSWILAHKKCFSLPPSGAPPCKFPKLPITCDYV